MTLNGCKRFLICLPLLFPLSVMAGGNSLLIPAPEPNRCALGITEDAALLNECQQLALAGDAQAAYELGLFYYDGLLAPPDMAQAVTWFERASLHGHAQAQYRLGMIFFQGEGQPVNKVQAYILLKMSAVNGDDEALDMADRVSAQMRHDELDAATRILSQIFRNYLMELQVMEERQNR